MATPSAPAKALSHLLERYRVPLAWLAVFAACYFFVDPIALTMRAESPGFALYLISVITIVAIGIASRYSANYLPVPSFVLAIIFGFLAGPLLAPLVGSPVALSYVVMTAALLILFQGGLETERGSFFRLLPKIAALAVPGVVFSAIIFAGVLWGLGYAFGAAITTVTAVLLSVAVASTDPAAIMPIMDELEFGANRGIKDIVVSESALNDVVGTLLTIALLGAATRGVMAHDVLGSFGVLLSRDSAIEFARQAGYGALGGLAGFGLMLLQMRVKKRHALTHGEDVLFFVVIALIAGFVAYVLGGSLFLAAFIAGLLFHIEEHHAEAAAKRRHLEVFERHFGFFIDGVAKPAIFGLLGALVDWHALVAYAPIGFAAAVLFVAVVRPVSVWLSLAAFTRFGRDRMTAKQVWFIAAIRATGVIPAMLLITIENLDIPGTEALLPIGMWVILGTLASGPLLAQKAALWCKVAQPKSAAQPAGADAGPRLSAPAFAAASSD
ncbi:MAG: cation:proton antiporter [Patescibacteria group bacterium]|nr:cation:proton antiporter [Patescibacteria group bacterium]MDE1943921.1 cation:proton antiporter [Patescibacteria group bacterium]MDE1944885.1 cation:proton antiporter [Patescibacteria group bacterium]MDE2057749.1 cation:proton antiporter [Patescibacteria group bacterium]